MPKTLYLSPRELATVIDALTLYAAEPDQTRRPPSAPAQIEHSPPSWPATPAASLSIPTPTTPTACAISGIPTCGPT